MSASGRQGAVLHILGRASAWPGVGVEKGRYGGWSLFLVEGELGCLHPCGLLDVPLTVTERNDLLAGGRVHPHHSWPESAWVTLPIDGEDDVPLALDLLRRTYARLGGERPSPQGATARRVHEAAP